MTTTLAERAVRRLPEAAGMRLPDFRDGLPAGDVAALAAVLDDVEVGDATSAELLARAVGWEQVVAMAQAQQARVLGELCARREVGRERVADELQAALSCTAFQAQRTVMRAEDLMAHPMLRDALGAGTLDGRRVDAILDALPSGGDPRRWNGVVAVLVEEAPLWSAPALKRQALRLVLAAEPGQAAERCARARRERGVELPPLEDGMALLSAYLPAPDAVTAFTVIDAMAGSSRVAGDERTVHQRRADALSDLFGGIADTGTLPDGSTLPRKHGRRAEVQVTVAATTLLGLDDLPGELAGHGPIPADMARAIARDGTWRRLLTDPVTGTLVERGTATYKPGADLTAFVIARDVTCTFMGCGQPAWRCELDHREPFDAARPARDQTIAANLDARCKHHHEQKTSGGWSVRRIAESGACEWTDPWGITFTRLAVPIVLTAQALARLRGPCDAPGDDADPPPRLASGGYPDEPPF